MIPDLIKRWLVPALGFLAHQACAQQPGPVPPDLEHGTHLVLLGTAGGPPIRKDRSEPASALIVAGRPYLIDAGDGTLRRLVEAGVRADAAQVIFITHHHIDHDLGLVALMGNDLFSIQAPPIQPWAIYGPPGTRQIVAAALNYLSVPLGVFWAEGLSNLPAVQATVEKSSRPDLAFRSQMHPERYFEAHEVEKSGLVFQDDRIRVIAAENSHYTLLPAGSPFRGYMKSYAYRIETSGRVVVFTGDTGPSDAVTQLAKGADLLVTEIVDLEDAVRFAESTLVSPAVRKQALEHMEHEHLTPENIGTIAAGAGVKAVLLTHVSALGGKTDMARYATTIQERYSGPVTLGQDLGVY